MAYATKKQVENHPKHLSEIETVPALFQAIGDDFWGEVEALGRADDKIQLKYGRKVDELVSEGARVGLACKAVAIKAGKSVVTVRNAYYTFKKFTPEIFAKYDACPYSVFDKARMQDNPEEVLQYYIDHRCSVDEIDVKYPAVEDKEFSEYFKTTKLPRIFYSVERELWGIDPIWKQEADEHIKALAEIIEKVNK